MDNISNKAIHFAQTASMKQKVYGHNKFQLQIQEANSTIERLNTDINEKNAEMNLFKNNIQQLNLQLQQKNIEIHLLNEKLQGTNDKYDMLYDDFNTFKQSRNDSDNIMEIEYANIINEKIILQDTVSQLTSSSHDLTSKYGDLKQKYQTTLDLMEQKDSTHKALLDIHESTTDELNLTKEINTRQISELDTLKQELQASRTENNSLKTKLSEKDACLKDLHKKFELEQQFFKNKKLNIQNDIQEVSVDNITPISDESIDNLTNNINRPIKVSHRGAKLSKR